MTVGTARDSSDPTTTVTADLRIDVDPGGGVGRVTAHLGGSGERLTLRTADAAAWWPLLSVPGVMTDASASGRRRPRRSPRLTAAGQAADVLRARGLRVDIVDDHGPVASLGADVRSRPGRLLVGSDAFAIASPRVAARWARPLLADRISAGRRFLRRLRG